MEYLAVKTVLKGLKKDGEELSETLLKRESFLVRRLIAVNAAEGVEVAYKASVLLDWLDRDDLPGDLTASLCRDAISVLFTASE